MSSFLSTWNASLNKIPLRGPQDKPSAAAQPLFDTVRVATLDQVPRFLQRADIILGFAHQPPYNMGEDGLFTLPPVSECYRVAGRVYTKFVKYLTDKWATAVKTTLPDFPRTVAPGESGDAGGHSFGTAFEHNVKFKDQKSDTKVFWSCNIGIVDIGPPANDALYVWTFPASRTALAKAKDKNAAAGGNVRLKIQNILMQFDAEGRSSAQRAFGVDAVKQAAKEGKELAPKFLEAIGRGLAYAAIHEFWHLAEQTDHRPDEYGQTDKTMESMPEVRHLGLTLQDKAIANIVKKCQKTWCRSVTDKRISLADIK